MIWFRVIFILHLIGIANLAVSGEVTDSARSVLDRAIMNGPGKVIKSGPADSGYPHLPDLLWRDSYERLDDIQWDLYFRLLENREKGRLIEKKITYYKNDDVYFIFWLSKDDTLLRYQKKIQNTTLLHLEKTKLELRVNAFINFDPEGRLIDVKENLLLIDNNNKESYFSSFCIDSQGEISELENGDFDYYQLK